MTRSVAILLLAFTSASFAQEEPVATPAPSPVESVPALAPTLPQKPPPKRGWLGRMLHPFSSGSDRPANYLDPQLGGLVLDLEVSPPPVKLWETGQVDVKLTVTNTSKRPIS